MIIYEPCIFCGDGPCAGHDVAIQEPALALGPPHLYLSNAELAEAIDWARDTMAHLGEAEKEFAPTLAHYQALLAEQRRRAEATP